MLIGEFSYTLDPKKRLAIPAKLRKEIGAKAVITRGLDSCLFIYPQKEWQALADKLNNLPLGQGATRSFARLMFSGAQEVDLDGLGRVLIPDYLKNYAGLKKEIVIVGVYNRLEVWDKEHWQAYQKEAERGVGNIAEKLGSLGAL